MLIVFSLLVLPLSGEVDHGSFNWFRPGGSQTGTSPQEIIVVSFHLFCPGSKKCLKESRRLSKESRKKRGRFDVNHT